MIRKKFDENKDIANVLEAASKEYTAEWGHMAFEKPLKPCPYCGNSPVEIMKEAVSFIDFWGRMRHGGIYHYVECSNPKCRAKTDNYQNIYVAMDRWNSGIVEKKEVKSTANKAELN